MKKLYFKCTILFLFLFCFHSANAQLANWSQTSGTQFPTNQSGQIHGMTRLVQLKHHISDTNKMYVLTAEGGLFTTTDKASNWTVKAGTENLTGSCASICIDYTNDQTIWLGTGDPNYYSNGQGILKSIDGGNTFSATSLTNCLVLHIFQNPLNATEYIAATNKGIYRSVDNGVTWVAKTSITLQFVDLVMNPGANSQTLFACTKDINPRLFKSMDFGETWIELTTGITYAVNFTTGGGRIALTPADTNVVYFEVIGGGGIMHKSIDGGTSFTVQKAEGLPYITFYDGTNSNGLGGQGNYNNCFWVDRNNPSKIWLQSHSTWESSDNGVTWTMITHWASKIHTDMHQLQQAPFNNNLLISLNDGGVWFSTDSGNNWIQKTNGISAFEVASNAGQSSKIRKDFVSIGTQDNGRLYANANGWLTIKGGDDYAKRETDYNGHVYFDGNKRQVNHTGAEVTYDLPTANWNALAFNQTDVNLGFMGVDDIWRTVNLASTTPTWTQISTFNSAIRAVHSCIADPTRLYVLLTNGDIYVSMNALDVSPTFTNYVLPGSASSLGSIVAMVNNADIVYVAENAAVYRSANGGQTWSNITYNLPNVNHRKILTESFGGSSELVFIGTNNAVYYKKAGQITWTNYSTNLPGRRAPTDFSMYDDGTNNAKIRYATYGRSVWESSFGNLRSLNCGFDANITYHCSPGTPITFTDKSTGNATSWSWSFPGGTPSSSTNQNPVVTYTTGGLYAATLTVSDGLTSSTITKNNYILVLNAAPTAVTGCTVASNSNLNNGFGVGIRYFGLQNIDKSTSGNDGHLLDYTCSNYTLLTAGNTYNATITTGTTNAEGALLYIDLNDNGIFSASEILATYPNNNTGTRTLSITIPSSGIVLNKGLRLRVVSRFNAVPTNACNPSTYGQVEDYTVYIQSASTAMLSNGSGSSSICAGHSANLKVVIAGGTSPYTVVISDGSTNQTFTSYVSGADMIVSPTITKTYSIISVTDNASNPIPGSGTATINVTTSTSSAVAVSACNSYTWSANSITYTTSGIYTNTFACDTDTLVLTINSSTSNTTAATSCASYTWLVNNMIYTTTGTYSVTSTNAAGCNHTEILNLTINSSTSNTTAATACASYTWLVNNVVYTTTGTYSVTSTNAAGCNHTEILNLTINNSTSNTTAATACASYTWLVNNMIYTTTGTYSVTSTNAAGCNHTEILNLTINSSTSNTTAATACASYTWLVNNVVYTTTGTYSVTSTNAAGCNHTEILNLTINSSTSKTTAATACASYTWLVNNVVYTTTGTYSVTSTNAAGCNHTEILNLTINSSTSNTTAATACASYTWLVNNVIYTTTGTYSVTSTNAAGCNHTEILNLTINSSTSNTTAATACASYTWLVNGNTYTTNGIYTATVACVTEVLNLTILENTTYPYAVTSNGCYTWPVNGATYTATGVYTFTIANVTTGCIDIHELTFTVNVGVLFSGNVLLAGPYNSATGLMYDSIRAILPTTEPYTGAPYGLPAIVCASGETITAGVSSVSGNNAIVDWVYLELRDPSFFNTVLATKRALVQRDGDIVSHTDGVSPVFFDGVAAGSYVVSVKHRNHLGVMTNIYITLTNCAVTNVLFSTNSVYVKPGIVNTPRKQVGSVYLLWSADCNNNKNVKYNGLSNDKDKVLTAVGGPSMPNNIVFGYRVEDANLDGKIRYNGSDNDRAIILSNVGVNTPNNILYQHTPN